MIAKIKISAHAVRVFTVLRDRTLNGEWVTAAQIARRAKVSGRSGRHYASLFLRTGLAQVQREFPEFKYRLTTDWSENESEYALKLFDALAVSLGFAPGRPTPNGPIVYQLPGAAAGVSAAGLYAYEIAPGGDRLRPRNKKHRSSGGRTVRVQMKRVVGFVPQRSEVNAGSK